MNINHTDERRKDEWLTPLPIIQALGKFDLDPCSPINRPWETAENYYTIEDDGLLMPWYGRVWLNPPYAQNEIAIWMNKMALNGSGIALLFARTDNRTFHDHIFPHITSMFFIKGRIKFYDVHGNEAKSNSGASSVLLGYSEYDSEMLDQSNIKGFHIPINTVHMIIVDRQPKTWRIIVGNALSNLNGKATLNDIYTEVMRLAPKRIGKNRHYKAKVRQTLQRYFDRIEKGRYATINEQH